jgi:hypothetical protein
MEPALRDFPPKRPPRFDAPTRRCPRCEMPSATRDAHCPVCGTRFEPTRWQRLIRALRRSA